MCGEMLLVENGRHQMRFRRMKNAREDGHAVTTRSFILLRHRGPDQSCAGDSYSSKVTGDGLSSSPSPVRVEGPDFTARGDG